ncbi:hypothetical protein GQ457_18G003560 [Hibiscus cannabinus]
MSACIDVAPEQLCYIPCNFCNIVLAVSVPCSSLFDIVTAPNYATQDHGVNLGSSSKCSNNNTAAAATTTATKFSTRPPSKSATEERVVNRPPEKRQRVPSAYNQFIKEEIQRIKANNPDISHREAFSTAAKNWAHFPHIHFGLMLENQPSN